MKKLVFILMASMLVMSCSNEALEEVSITETSFKYSESDYREVFGFIDCLYESELFNISKPKNPTYDEMMLLLAPIIMSDTFADTFAEGDCSKVYFLMYDYFKIMYPEASVTEYLRYIIINELY